MPVILRGGGRTGSVVQPANEHPLQHSEQILLNDGIKWKLDDASRKNIEALQEMVEAMEAKNNRTIKEYNEEGQRIQTQINILIQNCKMSGKGHEMLHLWLTPFINEVKELIAASELEKAENYFFRIDHELHRFDLFFE